MPGISYLADAIPGRLSRFATSNYASPTPAIRVLGRILDDVIFHCGEEILFIYLADAQEARAPPSDCRNRKEQRPIGTFTIVLWQPNG